MAVLTPDIKILGPYLWEAELGEQDVGHAWIGGAAYSTPQGLLPPLLVSGSYSHTALASFLSRLSDYVNSSP